MRGDHGGGRQVDVGGRTGRWRASTLHCRARASRISLAARRRLHSRTIEVLDQRGIADGFLSQGQVHPVCTSNFPLDISDFPTRSITTVPRRHVGRTTSSAIPADGDRRSCGDDLSRTVTDGFTRRTDTRAHPSRLSRRSSRSGGSIYVRLAMAAAV